MSRRDPHELLEGADLLLEGPRLRVEITLVDDVRREGGVVVEGLAQGCAA